MGQNARDIKFYCVIYSFDEHTLTDLMHVIGDLHFT